MNTPTKQHVALLIPFYNDAKLFLPFLRTIRPHFHQFRWPESLTPSNFRVSVVVVDDGSARALEMREFEHNAFFDESAFEKSCQIDFHLLRHPINLGQGAALCTALHYARDTLCASYFATIDSDGQHRLSDLSSMMNPVVSGDCDITFGNRFRGEISRHMPTSRRWILKGAVLFEKMITGTKLDDAHNGYRVFNKKAADFFRIRQNRMAHATEFKQLVSKHKLRYREVPVSIDYSADTLAGGQSNLGSFNILKDLLKVYLFGG